MELEQRQYSGQRAKDVLEADVFVDAFEQIEHEVIEQWKNSPARDEAGREKLWSYLQMMQKFRQHLTTTMETGKLAVLDIQHKQTMREKLRSVIG